MQSHQLYLIFSFDKKNDLNMTYWDIKTFSSLRYHFKSAGLELLKCELLSNKLCYLFICPKLINLLSD